uniref:Uncharacterized protein n=1 Tax=Anguilla anguilla TaxID=7936 RepID=A0A0E9PLF1_ANGAN
MFKNGNETLKTSLVSTCVRFCYKSDAAHLTLCTNQLLLVSPWHLSAQPHFFFGHY